MIDNKLASLLNQLAHYTDFEDDEVLTLTRAVRLNAVQKLTEKGIPTNLEDFEMLHKTLNELDKQALGKKRLTIDDNNAQLNATFLNNLLESIQRNVGGARDVFYNPNAEAATPNPEQDIAGKATLVDGELDVGVEDMTYEGFMSNQGKAIEEEIRRRAEEAFNN